MPPERAPTTATLGICPTCGRSTMIYARSAGGPRRCQICHLDQLEATAQDASTRDRARPQEADN
jgi:hypothetical protein